jgi:hypothetical protein
MRKNPRRILSPQRLPFRHPGHRQIEKSSMYESEAQRGDNGPDFVAAPSYCQASMNAL